MGEGGEGAQQWLQGSSCLVVCMWLDGFFFVECVLFVCPFCVFSSSVRLFFL